MDTTLGRYIFIQGWFSIVMLALGGVGVEENIQNHHLQHASSKSFNNNNNNNINKPYYYPCDLEDSVALKRSPPPNKNW